MMGELGCVDNYILFNAFFMSTRLLMKSIDN